MGQLELYPAAVPSGAAQRTHNPFGALGLRDEQAVSWPELAPEVGPEVQLVNVVSLPASAYLAHFRKSTVVSS